MDIPHKIHPLLIGRPRKWKRMSSTDDIKH